MKKLLFLCLILAGCQSKNDKQSKTSITVNGDSVVVDSTGNEVRIKAGGASVVVDSAGNEVRVEAGDASVIVSGSGNQVDIK